MAGLLRAGELDLWRRMSDADRRHAVGVARRVKSVLGGDGPELVAVVAGGVAPLLAAALLHDVGKVRCGLGIFGRVVATLLGAVAPGRTAGWSDRGGARGRIGLYLRHPEEGAALLSEAGSEPLTVAWATEHHLPPDRWTVDRRLADVLHAADDD